MKVSFKLPMLVAAIITSSKHAAITQACEATLNAGTVVDSSGSIRNKSKDMHADGTLTIETRQSISDVTAFIEYCQSVTRAVEKAEKLGFDSKAMKLTALPATFKTREIGAWIANFGKAKVSATTVRQTRKPATRKPAKPAAPAAPVQSPAAPAVA